MFSLILLSLFLLILKTSREIISIITTLVTFDDFYNDDSYRTRLYITNVIICYNLCELFIIGIFDIKWWALAKSFGIVELYKL